MEDSTERRQLSPNHLPVNLLKSQEKSQQKFFLKNYKLYEYEV